MLLGWFYSIPSTLLLNNHKVHTIKTPPRVEEGPSSPISRSSSSALVPEPRHGESCCCEYSLWTDFYLIHSCYRGFQLFLFHFTTSSSNYLSQTLYTLNLDRSTATVIKGNQSPLLVTVSLFFSFFFFRATEERERHILNLISIT